MRTTARPHKRNRSSKSYPLPARVLSSEEVFSATRVYFGRSGGAISSSSCDHSHSPGSGGCASDSSRRSSSDGSATPSGRSDAGADDDAYPNLLTHDDPRSSVNQLSDELQAAGWSFWCGALCLTWSCVEAVTHGTEYVKVKLFTR